MIILYKKNNELTMKVNPLVFLGSIAIFFFNKALLDDDTANVILISIFITYFLSNHFDSKRSQKVMGIIYGLFPIIIGGSSLGLGYIYNPNHHVLYEINTNLTQRLFVWNYYLKNYSSTLIPKPNQITNMDIVEGNFDGFYVYIWVFFGVLFFLLIVLGMALSNYKLYKNRNYAILSLMVGFEILGFSETVILSCNYNFAIFFALLAFYPDWLQLQNKNIKNKYKLHI